MKQKFSEAERKTKLEFVNMLLILGGLLGTLLSILQPSTGTVSLFSFFIGAGIIYYLLIAYELEERVPSLVLYSIAMLLSGTFSGLLAILWSKGLERPSLSIALIGTLSLYAVLTVFIFVFLVRQIKK